MCFDYSIALITYIFIVTACNIMVEGVAPYYTLRNRGAFRNCSLTAVFPAVMSVVGVDVGGRKDGVNYDVSLFVV